MSTAGGKRSTSCPAALCAHAEIASTLRPLSARMPNSARRATAATRWPRVKPIAPPPETRPPASSAPGRVAVSTACCRVRRVSQMKRVGFADEHGRTRCFCGFAAGAPGLHSWWYSDRGLRRGKLRKTRHLFDVDVDGKHHVKACLNEGVQVNICATGVDGHHKRIPDACVTSGRRVIAPPALRGPDRD